MANRHLSYNEFKNIFGDLGITEWTKYNWLDNNFNLPSNLCRVEYIEFTGEQWLDTGLVSTLTDIWKQEADIQYTTLPSSGSQLNGADYGVYWGVNNTYGFVNSTTTALTPAAPADTDRHNFVSIIDPSITNNVFYIDGVEHKSARANFNTAKIAIGCIGSPTGANLAYLCKEKVYSYKIFKNDELVRSFIPVFNATTATYGLYDLVGRQFYSNAGTGYFAGPYINFVKLSTLTWNKSGSTTNSYWAQTVSYTEEQRQKAQLVNSDNYNWYLTDEVYGPEGTLMLNSTEVYIYKEVHVHATEDLTVEDFITTLGDSYIIY